MGRNGTITWNLKGNKTMLPSPQNRSNTPLLSCRLPRAQGKNSVLPLPKHPVHTIVACLVTYLWTRLSLHLDRKLPVGSQCEERLHKLGETGDRGDLSLPQQPLAILLVIFPFVHPWKATLPRSVILQTKNTLVFIPEMLEQSSCRDKTHKKTSKDHYRTKS